MSNEQAAQREMMRLAAPGPQHRRLAELAGTYMTTTRFSVAEGAPPQESSGEARLEMVLDDRFLREENSGTMFSQLFSGIRMYGFNNASGCYEGIWLYTGATSFMFLAGPKGNDIKLEGAFDAGPGGKQEFSIELKENADGFEVDFRARAGYPRSLTTYTRAL